MRNRECHCLRPRILSENNSCKRKWYQCTSQQVRRMMQNQNRTKMTDPYWRVMRETANRVQSWPAWKVGEVSVRQPVSERFVGNDADKTTADAAVSVSNRANVPFEES